VRPARRFERAQTGDFERLKRDALDLALAMQ
jgi:hypothetical protein